MSTAAERLAFLRAFQRGVCDLAGRRVVDIAPGERHAFALRLAGRSGLSPARVRELAADLVARLRDPLTLAAFEEAHAARNTKRVLDRSRSSWGERW